MVWRWVERAGRALLVSPEALFADPRLAARELDPDRVCDVAGVQRLAELGPANVRVIHEDDLLSIGRRLETLRSAVEHGIRLLFVDASAGGVELRAALGQVVVPLEIGAHDTGAIYGVSVVELLRRSLAEDADAREVLAGMSTRRMSPEAVAVLPASLPVERVGRLRRLLLDPRVGIYLIVFVYSSLRVLPVALIEQFHGSLLVLWLIDLVTAVPYTWGVLAMLFAPRRRTRIIATLTTLVTFITPYVYFWFNGSGYPPYVPVIIAGLTLLSVVLEGGKYLQERRLRRRCLTIGSAGSPRGAAAAALSI